MQDLEAMALRLRELDAVHSRHDDAMPSREAPKIEQKAAPERHDPQASASSSRGSSLASILAPLLSFEKDRGDLAALTNKPASAAEILQLQLPSQGTHHHYHHHHDAAVAADTTDMAAPAPPPHAAPHSRVPSPLLVVEDGPAVSFPPLILAAGGTTSAGSSAGAADVNAVLEHTLVELRRLQSLLLGGALFRDSIENAAAPAAALPPRGATRVRLLPDMATIAFERSNGHEGLLSLTDITSLTSFDDGRGLALIGEDGVARLSLVASDRILGCDWLVALATLIALARARKS